MRAGLVLMFLVMAGGLCSCGKEGARAPGAEEKAPKYAVRRAAGDGPVRFRLELSDDKISVADVLRCRMTLESDPDYEAEFPDVVLPDDVPGTILTGYAEREETRDGRRVRVREYELEPEYEGELKFPLMEVYYYLPEEVQEDTLEIEPIVVSVAAVDLAVDQLAFKPVQGLVTVSEIEAADRSVWPWVAGGLAAVAGLTVLLIWWRRRPKKAAPPPPPHVLALERLQALARRDLITQGQFEPFYVEVTGIVRDYIEGAFGIRAPEQTTQEFLANMMTEPRVARYRDVLQPFLTAADEVKFARFVPDTEAMHRAFDTADDFVRTASSRQAQEKAA